MRISALFRYPVKGFSPEPLESVVLEAGRHVPGDRLFAVENGPCGWTAQAPVHLPKVAYLQLMRNPSLAMLATAYDPDTGVFTIREEGTVAVAGDLGTAAGRTAIEGYLANRFASDLRGPPRVLGHPDWRFMDTARSGFMSLISLATVDQLGAELGATLDPVRFRGNVLFEGAAPWAEFAWVGQRVRIGSALIDVTKRIERCAATAANPATGQRDIDIVRHLDAHQGHIDCGVYAKIVSGGRVAVGDAISVVGAAPEATGMGVLPF
jgi:uncharacterized protein YcbX